jgi:hypothetical protein
MAIFKLSGNHKLHLVLRGDFNQENAFYFPSYSAAGEVLVLFLLLLLLLLLLFLRPFRPLSGPCGDLADE